MESLMTSKLAKGKSRLGRGLSSLISVSELPVEAEVEAPSAGVAAPTPTDASHSSQGGSIDIEVDKITTNPHQPRKQFSEQSIAELAATLKSTGLVQPIVVRPDGYGYQLIAGERRWR